MSLLGIGDSLVNPIINFNGGAVVHYESSGDLLVEAQPISIQLTPGGQLDPIGGDPISGSDAVLDAHVLLNSNGELSGNAPGDDFSVYGDIGNSYELLLSGEATAFGYAADVGGVDQYEFRFTPTGGALLGYFSTDDIGLRVDATNDGFNNDFTVNFDSLNAEGIVGAILSSGGNTGEPASISGVKFQDNNADGVRQAGEPGLPGWTIFADADGNNSLDPDEVSTVTGADGSYTLTGLTPGSTYTILEQPQPGWTQSLGTYTVTPGEGEVIGGKDFGNYQQASIGGLVFCDNNLDNTYQSGEDLEQNALVTLKSGNSTVGTQMTTAAGTFNFTGLTPGSYTVLLTTPSSGHQAEIAAASTLNVTVSSGQNSTGNNFAEIKPGSISGNVYSDIDDDGVKDSTEPGIGGVTLTLTGNDYLGNAVTKTVTTMSNGSYSFTGLLPSNAAGYTITETQPAGYLDGQETLGTINGVTVGTASDSKFTGLTLPGCDNTGVDYNFGELGIFHGLTATIGFWHNKNGQALLNSFGTTSNGLTLANWLASTFPNLFGNKAPKLTSTTVIGANLTGKSDADVAAYFMQLFSVTGQKAYAQVLATAFAVFTTTNSLNTGAAGRSLAAKYGFVLSNTGAGASTYVVPSADWAAFGITSSSGATKTISQLLVCVNSKAIAGVLNGGNATLIGETNAVFNAVNNNGDIGFGMALMGASAEDATEGSDALPGDLLFAGTYLVSIDVTGAVDPTNERARILDAMVQLNANLATYGIVLSELPAGMDVGPDITIHFSDTTDIGGMAQGVLGVSEAGGQVTLVNGWNYYFGSSATAVGSSEYDFETVAMHELGHAIGLGHSPDTNSAMYPYLGTATARRKVTFSDLSIDSTAPETQPEPLLAANRHAGRHAKTSIQTRPGYAFVPGNAPLIWTEVTKHKDKDGGLAASVL